MTLALHGQNKQLSLKDAVLNRSLRSERLSQVGWVKGTHTAYYVHPDNQNKLIFYNVDAGSIDSSFSFTDFANSAAAVLGDTLSRLPRITFEDQHTLSFLHKMVEYHYNLKTKTAKKFMTFPTVQAMDFHRESENLAYVKNNNIYVKHLDEEAKQITQDGGNGIVYGQAVHRNEFGIMEGLFWSKGGNKLAFYRMDETLVTDYPIYNLKDTPAAFRNIKYPVAGAKSHHVTVGIFNIADGSILYLKTEGDPESYLTNLAWTPNEQNLLIARLNRGQNKMELEEYDGTTGKKVRTHFTETDSRYVEPENPVLYQKGEDNCYYWQSERDGYNHIYQYKNGKLKKQITKGNWLVTGITGQDKANKKNGNLYFTSTQNSPLETNYYYVSKEGGTIQSITKDAGTHRCIPNADYSLWIDIFSSMDVPNRTQIIDLNGNNKKVLHNAANPLTDFQLGKTKVFTMRANNTQFYARMITPPNFDSTKTYPVITYVYGGPHAQMITNRFLGGSNYWMQMMAQKGYIVFTMDNRGSKNRGFEFESVIHRQVGDAELADQLAGVKYLKSLPYVDTTRMGVHGWSFGGFMTTSLMTRHPEAYQVGVAGGPVIDWNYYEIMYTERYMDTPEENIEGYSKNSLLQYVDNLKGRLLMIHGTDDPVVLWQHSLLYVKAAVDANNTNLDYFVYPGHPHNVRGKDRLHLMGKITQYFEDHL